MLKCQTRNVEGKSSRLITKKVQLTWR